ncbi:hypothetical protein [Endozoicomonas sp. ONNA2]|uniref:hypothetical protein n=1 Tax=Endozoicomonas sp. ONNA2 TaxID=2828741 RepID=UPI002149612D|nr:hypothetical protein [Endozoicomonas sp. ONNA2]
MSSVELGALSAMSYCWHKHEDSFFVVRAAKAIAGAVKATFGKFTVELLQEAKPLMLCHPDAWFAAPVKRALDDYDVSVAQDTARQPSTAGSPPATSGSPPPLPQEPRVPVNSPFTFSLDETVTTRVRFLSEAESTSPDVSTAYKEMRKEAGELWIENTSPKVEVMNLDAIDNIVFGNKNHEVISKYKVQYRQPNCKWYSIEEVLKVRDKSNGQMKLVRVGSFSDCPDGSTVGGAGFPGYSDDSSNKVGNYLQRLEVYNNEGNIYKPYENVRFGLGPAIDNNRKIGKWWSCGFDALRLGLYQTTGYKFSFLVLVAFLEEMINHSSNPQEARKIMANGNYPFGLFSMIHLLIWVNPDPKYPNFLVEEDSDGYYKLTKEARKNAEKQIGDIRIVNREDITDPTIWDSSSTAILGQPAHAFGVYRNRKADGTFEYMVYDPHNFDENRDFYTSDNGEGRMSFATAEEAIEYVTTCKPGHNGKVDAFIRVTDPVMCFLRERMLKTKNRLEENGEGF